MFVNGATISNNTITGGTFIDGLSITHSSNLMVTGNSISDGFYQAYGESSGIELDYSTNVTVAGNNISYTHIGMQITGTNQSAIYHNNFIQNDSQAYQSNTSITWDNGYPSGGNYWSNYAGVDNCSGPQQNICPSPDGIGDTPPSIDGTVYQDRYPLMKPFTAQNHASPPGVTVSPPTPNPASTGSVVNVAFSVSSSSTVTGITVNWGDGTAADNLAGTARSDSHVYTSTGAVKSKTFTITVTATNGAGPGSGTTTEVVNDRPPVVTISSITPPSPFVGQSVTVSFSATAPDGSANPISLITVNWGGDGRA